MTRSVVIWFVLLAIASMNGALREALLIPMFGETTGRAVSSLMLSVLIVLLTWLSIRWMHPTSRTQTWTIGSLWLALTLAFEFLAGHYLFGNPWSRLLEDYDVMHGRIWVIVLITTFVAPRACAAFRGLAPRSA